MTLSVLSPDACEIPSWMGWEIERVELLLHADLDGWQIGTCLSELLAARMLPEGASFRVSLYRHQPERNRYERVGEWSGLQEAERVVHARPTPESQPVEREIDKARQIDSDHELFLPLEADQVLGFILFRGEGEARLREAPQTDLSFLGHAGGAALLRLRDAERLVFAHRALASTARYLEEALELQRDAILAIDPEGRIVAANEAVEAVLGVLPSDLIGRLAAHAFPHQTAATLLAGAQIASHQAGRFHRLLRLMVPEARPRATDPQSDPASNDGSSPRLQARTIEASFVCVQLDLEASPAVLVSLRDVHHGEDEAWFRERESAGEALRGKALLRPVAALRGYLGLLRDELPMRGRIVDLLHALDLQAEWLQGQLESHALLDEFRGGVGCWRDRPVSPWVLVERAIARVRSRLEAHGIRALRNVPDDLPWLRVDVEKWVVALSHLMEWAVHRVEGPCVLVVEPDDSAMPGRVGIQIRVEPSPGTRCLDLENLGIPDREFPYGLPLARSVVHHYGGTLVCEAPPGSLPHIKLTIPLDESDHERHTA